MGNRTSSVTDGTTTSYMAANTNTYTAVGGVSWTTDINGNVTNDGSRTFTWEVHDRLVQVQQGGAVTGTYRYDALGRRISQTVGNGSAAKTTRFLYNLWNVMGEFETAAGSPAGAVTVMRRNIWGHDLSGTPQGASGVGGLLMIEDRSSGTPVAHYVCQDGNGNVIRLLTTGSGGGVITSAVYTYDPFGKVRTGFGTFAATNRWRFSTKLEDAETGLNYYGYRYYDPVAGRWLSRDPIGEKGGLNLYGLVGNNPAHKRDRLGLEEQSNDVIARGAGQCSNVCEKYFTFHIGDPSQGRVICCGGREYSCGNPSGLFVDGADPTATRIAKRCAGEHEHDHHVDVPAIALGISRSLLINGECIRIMANAMPTRNTSNASIAIVKNVVAILLACRGSMANSPMWRGTKKGFARLTKLE